jgi:hypothetical protein
MSSRKRVWGLAIRRARPNSPNASFDHGRRSLLAAAPPRIARSMTTNYPTVVRNLVGLRYRPSDTTRSPHRTSIGRSLFSGRWRRILQNGARSDAARPHRGIALHRHGGGAPCNKKAPDMPGAS